MTRCGTTCRAKHSKPVVYSPRKLARNNAVIRRFSRCQAPWHFPMITRNSLLFAFRYFQPVSRIYLTKCDIVCVIHWEDIKVQWRPRKIDYSTWEIISDERGTWTVFINDRLLSRISFINRLQIFMQIDGFSNVIKEMEFEQKLVPSNLYHFNIVTLTLQFSSCNL